MDSIVKQKGLQLPVQEAVKQDIIVQKVKLKQIRQHMSVQKDLNVLQDLRSP